jgi:hypothetical protein
MPPVLPVTKRAELTTGRATMPPAATAGAGVGGNPSGPALATPGAAIEQAGIEPTSSGPTAIEPAGGDLYLLSTERSTGQPAPPAALLSQSERLTADRPGRLAVGLSRA